jgi:outer membrane biosynthesis protein TonB
MKGMDDNKQNQPAMDAVKQWRYEPYIEDGEPHPVVFTVTVNFKLK